MQCSLVIPYDSIRQQYMTKAKPSFFSVIVPTYNRENFLTTALKSVLDQTFKDFEVIIVDDGSTDRTKAIIRGIEDNRIKYIYQKNHGVAHARNRGIEKSEGKFISFLDSDDKWVPQKLQRTFQDINEFSAISIFHTEELWYKGGKLLNQRKKHKKPNGYVYQYALPLCCISISTAVVKQSVFEDIGIFDETLPACEDYDFWLRATHKYEVKLIKESLTIKDGGRPDQLSSQRGLDRYRIKALEKMLLSKELNRNEYELTRKELVKKCLVFSSGAEKRGKFDESKFYKNLIITYK